MHCALIVVCDKALTFVVKCLASNIIADHAGIRNVSIYNTSAVCLQIFVYNIYFFSSSDVMETMRHHKPIMRNSRNNSSSRSSNNNNNGTNHQHATSHQKSSVPLPQMSPVENYY